MRKKKYICTEAKEKQTRKNEKFAKNKRNEFLFLNKTDLIEMLLGRNNFNSLNENGKKVVKNGDIKIY